MASESSKTLNRLSRRIALYFWSALTVLLLMAALLGVSEMITMGGPVVRAQVAQFGDIHQIELIVSGSRGGLAFFEMLLLIGGYRATVKLRRRLVGEAENLGHSEQFARATVDALRTQISILDSSGIVLAVNKAWREFTCEDDTVIERCKQGTHYLAVCDSATGKRSAEAAQLSRSIREILSGQQDSVEFESAGHSKSGQLWYMCRITRFPGHKQNMAVVSFEEITRRKQAEEAVQKAREIADAANAAKSAFLANMSHEIRTPMTAILGYADLMLSAQQTASDRQRCARIIRRNGEHLLAIINDILDISKIEAQKMQVERIDCELLQLISDVAALTRMRALEKSLKLEFVFDGSLPMKIQTDPLRARQVLVNLIGNAIKFTEKGSVRVRVASQETLNGSMIHFDIIDTGIGMSETQLGRLFKAFSQGDESTTRKFGGTGLGLNISKRLAGLLGGDVSVVSRLGEGSTFSVWIEAGLLAGVAMRGDLSEADLSAVENQAQNQTVSLAGKVLVAEDGQDNRELVQTYLESAGLEVITAENGRIAIELAMSANPDLVLMDMQMPEIDGYGASKELRSQGFTKPIIALTANAMGDDRNKCIEAGCVDYLAKPIERDVFFTTLAKYLPKGGAAPRNNGLRGTIAGAPKIEQAVKRFIARLPQRVDEMHGLLEKGNLHELEQAVHRLKGAAGGYGFADITEHAAFAEQLLRGQAAMESIRHQIQGLISLVQRIEGYPQQPLPGVQPVAKATVKEEVPLAKRLRVDPQTGLTQRWHLEQRLPAELSQARRMKQPLACVILELSELAEVQQSIGDVAMSQLLRSVGLLLSTQLSNDPTIYRYAPTRLLMIFNDTNCNAATAMAHRLATIVGQQYFEVGSQSVRLTCRFGVAEATSRMASAPELLAAVEQSLAQVPAAGSTASV